MFSSYTRMCGLPTCKVRLDPGANVVSAELRMPREYNWSVDVQRQLPGNMVVNLGYVGNRGRGLLATNTISSYPKELLVPSLAATSQIYMASPNAGQTPETTITGNHAADGIAAIPVSLLRTCAGVRTASGQVAVSRHDCACGAAVQPGAYSILTNYTFGRLMDDVGGADGQGGKTVQSFDSYTAAWGLSPLDRKHRLNVSWTYEFPFGRAACGWARRRAWRRELLDKVVGGWQVAGNYSSTPARRLP